MDAVLIAIAGGSGSGKTWLTRRLQRRLGALAGTLAMDDFYHDLGHLPSRQRARLNFDDPDALDWALLVTTLKALRRGETVSIPRYDFATHTRGPRPRLARPRPVILVEGLWPWWPRRYRSLYALSVYCDCPEALRLDRRIERDRRERQRSRAAILRQFREHVRPMHDRFVAPQARSADEIVGPDLDAKTVVRLAERIRALVKRPRR